MNTIIQIENLNFAYEKKTVIAKLSLNIEQGSFLAIAGPNGIGKTTLLNLMCGLLRPTSGQILIDSVLIGNYHSRELARKIAIVRQESRVLFDFTVAEVVAMGRTPYLGLLGFESAADKEIITEALRVTDTIELAHRPIGQLSSGEKQRVFIARALAQETPIIMLDEPTSFLDLKHQVTIYDLLKQLQLEKNKTIIAVTHDINLAMQYCEMGLLLFPDKSFCFGKTEMVFSQENVESAFSVKTLSAKIGTQKIIIPVGKFSK